MLTASLCLLPRQDDDVDSDTDRTDRVAQAHSFDDPILDWLVLYDQKVEIASRSVVAPRARPEQDHGRRKARVRREGPARALDVGVVEHESRIRSALIDSHPSI